MTRKLLGIALGLSMIALAHPASAFVDNTAIILKDKDIEVLEHVRVLKRVVIAPRLELRDLTGAAEAQAFTNQANINNEDNAVPETPPFTEFDPVFVDPEELIGFGWTKEALITGSVNDNTGVTQVNQNAGVFNNQLNQVALGVGFSDGAVALSESALGQWNQHNQTREFNNSRSAQISGSGNMNTGVTMGNQAAGYMANQANMVSVSAVVAAPAATAGLNTVANAITPRF